MNVEIEKCREQHRNTDGSTSDRQCEQSCKTVRECRQITVKI